jgi:ketopantoate reductase
LGVAVRALIIGGGVIGNVYAAQLHLAGHSVVILAHPARAEQINEFAPTIRDGRSRDQLTVPVRCVTTAAGAPYDFVAVAVRFEQLPSLSAALSDITGDPTVLIFGNNPRGDRPANVPASRGRLGFPGIGGTRIDGVIEYAHIKQQPTALEADSSGTLDEFAESLTQRGFAIQRVANMQGWLAHHAVFVASVCAALYRCQADPVALSRSRKTISLMCWAVTEGFSLLRRHGVGGAPTALATLHLGPLHPAAIAYWSRAMRSPMGELCFAAHARRAGTEMRAIADSVLAQVHRGAQAPHLIELLQS